MKSTDSKEQIIKDYDKIIKYVIKDMKLGYRFEELYDIGMVGFVQGINTYDETKNYTIMTYLYDCIKNEILHHLNYEKAKKRQAEVISLNTRIKDKHNNLTVELQELIGYETDYEQNNYIDELISLIEKRTVDFTKKQWIIFNHLYGMNGYKELTTSEITKKYGFSRQSIYQIKKKTLRMLKFTLNKYQNEEKLYEKGRNNQDIHFIGLG